MNPHTCQETVKCVGIYYLKLIGNDCPTPEMVV